MADPMNEIFNGTPEAMDEDDLKAFEAISTVDIDMPVDPEEQPQPTSQESQPQPQQQASTEAKPKEQKKDQTSIFEEGYDAGDLARNVSEAALSIPTGALDFGVETLNIIPGVDLPKLPKFHNNTATAIREIFSIVGPTIGLTLSGVGALGAAAKASKLKILADPLFKKLATMGFSAGVGVGVDAISEQSEDDNLLGTIKQSAPPWIADMIPQSMATYDGESTESKRNKNILEGLGLGLFTDVLSGAAKLFRGLRGVDKATRYIPESEKAANWFKKNGTKKADTPLKEMDASAAKRSTDLDDIGAQRLMKSQNLDEPTLGIHDMYGYEEMGARSADDMGIVGASVDLVKINKNIDGSYGRLGSVMTEPALKFALEGAEEYGTVMKGLRDSLSQADEFGYVTLDGKVINYETIRDAGEQLASEMGYMTKTELEKKIKSFETGIDANTQLPQMTSEGVQAVRQALKNITKEFGDGVADSLTRVSISGQVSDMATGMRYSEGSAAYQRAQEQILDRIELLMVANGQAAKQAGFNLGAFNMARKGAKQLSPDDLRKQGADITKQLQAEAAEVRAVLQEVSEKNPEMLGPLIAAYEATNGSVKSMDALNNYVRNSYGVFSKAIVDGDAEIPSVVMRGFWANVYNNVLSAVATPLRAVASNTAVLMEQAVTPFAGAMMTGDKIGMQRAMYMLKSYGDAMANGRKYFAESMRRSALDPNYTGGAGRESLIQQNEAQMDVLRAFADAAEAQGDLGPAVMFEQVQAINDLAEHPLLRMGNRLMQATDGFTQAFMGTIHSHGTAFDKVYRTNNFDADMITQLQETAYKEIWGKDEMGREIITDKALKYASGEVAMNNNNDVNDAVSNIIKRVPALKPFLLFTRTPLNMMGFAASHTPLGRFIKEVNLFEQPIKEVPIEKLKEALASRQIPYDEMAEVNYNNIRREMKGRKAMGTVYTMGAVTLFLNSSLTGDGVADRQTQKVRRDADWQKRSFKTPTGHWVSYDGLGALSDVVALTANIMDNFDTLGEANLQKLLTGMGFVLSASVTDKTMLAGIEPIYDIVNGNGAAINRWAAPFAASAILPGSSQMAELTRLISPNLRVVEEQFFAMMANRTPGKLALPEQYDWIDGSKINESNNIFSRLWNTYSPMKVGKKISPVKQFLIDVEYDSRPSMSTDGRGQQLDLEMQAKLYQKIGTNRLFYKEVEKLMNTTGGKEFREAFKKSGYPDKKKFTFIFTKLNNALRLAKTQALEQMDNESRGFALSQARADANREEQESLGANIQEILSINK